MKCEQSILKPRALKRGDKIMILSPSGIIKPQFVYETMSVLADNGFKACVGEHTFDRYLTYAGTAENRLKDFEKAFLDPETRAILCSRGGYGAVQLLEALDRIPLRNDPKWIIGYSDVTALHGLMTKHGIESIHSPMAKHISSEKGKDEYTRRLFSLLLGESQTIEIAPHPLNRVGESEGFMTGGNLAVMAGLLSTPFNLIEPGTILFIEDISEQIYKVERIFYTLRLSGVLEKLSGLIVGQFTNYTDPFSRTHEEIISAMVEDFSYPVVFNFPVGHVKDNLPLLCSAKTKLTVSTEKVRLIQS